MKKRKLLGILSVILGAILIINSQSAIFLSPGESPINISLIAGLVFVFVGIWGMFAKQKRDDKKERVVSTDASKLQIWEDGIPFRGGYKEVDIGKAHFYAEVDKKHYDHLDLYRKVGKKLKPWGRYFTGIKGLSPFSRKQAKKRQDVDIDTI
jgi:hypothetical protein